jgi:hypothetical protein
LALGLRIQENACNQDDHQTIMQAKPANDIDGKESAMSPDRGLLDDPKRVSFDELEQA